MIEYIDKHATAEHIDMYAKLLTMGDYRSGMMKAKEILLNQESVDIAPSIPKIKRGTDIVQVVHARWENYSPVTIKCSQCGHVIHDWRYSECKYCTNCGTKMDGGEEHEQT